MENWLIFLFEQEGGVKLKYIMMQFNYQDLKVRLVKLVTFYIKGGGGVQSSRFKLDPMHIDCDLI